MASRINYAPGIVARTADEADAFYRDVYAGLGLTPTPELMRFAQAWRLSEAGRAAWNPFNTTWARGKASDYNTVGVGNYPDRAAGLAATVGTLRLATLRSVNMDPTTLSMLEQAPTLALAVLALVELRGMRASVADLAKSIALLHDRERSP
jgi:hypothetical protein